MEFTFWKLVGDLSQKGLVGRITSSEGVEPDASVSEIDFRSNESMRPVAVDREGVSQQAGGTFGASSSQEYDATLRRCLQIQLPCFGERFAVGSIYDPCRCSATAGGDEFCRLCLQGFPRRVRETGPHFRLPATVEVLDSGLKSRLLRRGEDRRDVQRQTQTDDPPDRVGVVMRSLENRVVVKLCISGQAKLAPVLKQGVEHGFCSDFGPRPRGNQAAMQGTTVEDFQVEAPFDDEALNDVKTVQFGASGGNVGQVPSTRRRCSAGPLSAVQSPTTFQYPTKGAQRGQRLDPTFFAILGGSLRHRTHPRHWFLSVRVAKSTQDLPGQKGSCWQAGEDHEADQTNPRDPDAVFRRAGPNTGRWTSPHQIAWLPRGSTCHVVLPSPWHDAAPHDGLHAWFFAHRSLLINGFFTVLPAAKGGGNCCHAGGRQLLTLGQ